MKSTLLVGLTLVGVCMAVETQDCKFVIDMQNELTEYVPTANDKCNSFSAEISGVETGYSWQYWCDDNDNPMYTLYSSVDCSTGGVESDLSYYRSSWYNCGKDDCAAKIELATPCDEETTSFVVFTIKKWCWEYNSTSSYVECTNGKMTERYYDDTECDNEVDKDVIFKDGCDQDDDLDYKIKCSPATMFQVSLFALAAFVVHFF